MTGTAPPCKASPFLGNSMRAAHLISLAEVAFMAGATVQEIDRVFADEVLAPALTADGSAQGLVPLVAPLTSFCLATCGDLTPSGASAGYSHAN